MKALDPGVRILSETEMADRIRKPAPVMVVFYADWCPFSERSMPIIRDSLDEIDMEVVAANISHPKDPRWKEHSIDTVPTVAVFEQGTELRRSAARRGQRLEEDDLLSLEDKAREDRSGEEAGPMGA